MSVWGGGVLTGMLTYDFSLCLIQCAISRCIIYIYIFFVRMCVCLSVWSLAAVTSHNDDGDEDDDGASFPQKRRCQAPPAVSLLRNVPPASISLSHLKQTNKQQQQTNKATTGRAHLSNSI